MRHRITIQSATDTPDGQGGFVETWADSDTVWGYITTLKAYQRFQAMQLETPATHKIILRYNDNVTAGTRLRFGTRVFWVQEIINIEQRNRFLELKVNERVGATVSVGSAGLDFSQASNSMYVGVL